MQVAVSFVACTNSVLTSKPATDQREYRTCKQYNPYDQHRRRQLPGHEWYERRNRALDDFTKVDARLTLTNAGHSWELSLIGRNLNDKTTSNYGDDVPGQAGSVWRSMDAPRSFAVQAVARF